MAETALRRPPRTALLDSETRNYDKGMKFEEDAPISWEQIDIERMIANNIWAIPWQGVHTKGKDERRKNPWGLQAAALTTVATLHSVEEKESGEGGEGGERNEETDENGFTGEPGEP